MGKRPHGVRLGVGGGQCKQLVFPYLDSFKGKGRPGTRINFHQTTLRTDVTLGNGAFAGQAVNEPSHAGFDFAPQDRFPRTGHPQIGLVGGSAFEYSSVGGGHVRMRAEDQIDLAVEEPSD